MIIKGKEILFKVKHNFKLNPNKKRKREVIEKENKFLYEYALELQDKNRKLMKEKSVLIKQIKKS